MAKDSTIEQDMPRSAQIPHPRQRRQPLPGCQPKPSQDDEAAPKAVQKILDCPSYRQADEDLDFLHEPETRGIRLELEYLKAESLLKEHRIAHTIVVFGGSRIVERGAATRELREIEQALAKHPQDGDLGRKRKIAERVLEKSKYYDMAREFGRIVGHAEDDAQGERIVVMTGGGPGIMEAANRGASDAGARTVGLNITLPHEQFPNPYVTPELCLRFRYFALRKLHFVMRARALVAFPGGFGTMDELFEILTLSQTRKMVPVPVVLVGEDYWRKLVDLDFLVDEGTIDPEDRELLWYANSAEGAWKGILHWYEMKGEPLLKRAAVP
jgi:uncharacterized protein (TIGR00730 family)